MSEKRKIRSVVKDLPPIAPLRRWPNGRIIKNSEEWWRYPASDPRSKLQAPKELPDK